MKAIITHNVKTTVKPSSTGRIIILMCGFSKGSYLDTKYSTLCRWIVLFIFSWEKPSFAGIILFSVTCLSGKCPFPLCKSNCVWWWVTGILMDSGLKYKDINVIKSPTTASPWVGLEAWQCHPGSRTSHLCSAFSPGWPVSPLGASWS